jgi:hypothetical protein
VFAVWYFLLKSSLSSNALNSAECVVMIGLIDWLLDRIAPVAPRGHEAMPEYEDTGWQRRIIDALVRENSSPGAGGHHQAGHWGMDG